ncbi:MAG: glycosyltransferase [Anaerolineae bacterium]|nr:glycosyltransferase [Anaerolineae bacterium]
MNNDKADLVSVIIPTYNRADLLPQTLATILGQTYPQVEIIVVDDGSTDDTPAVLAQYADRIQIIRQENQGEAAARNHGLAAATGAYLSFLDDDDLLLPNKVERQVHFLQQRSEVDVLYSRYYQMDAGGNLLAKVGMLPERDILAELVYGNFIFIGSAMVRRRCVEQAGGFDLSLPFQGKYSEDWEWFLRLALLGCTFACIQTPLCAYRMGPISQTANVAHSEQGIMAILDRLFANPELPEKIAAAKDHVYAVRHLWLSSRYYAAGHWDEGQHHLQKGLALHPAWQTDPEAWTQPFYQQATSYRVADPVAYIEQIFAHLPAELASYQSYRDLLLSRLYVHLALRDGVSRQWVEANTKLKQAVHKEPTLRQSPNRLAEMVKHTALHLVMPDPLRYVNDLLTHLPLLGEALARLRPQIRAYVALASAFEMYAAAQKRSTLYYLFIALSYAPGHLKNRGVLAILLKSLLPIRWNQYSL